MPTITISDSNITLEGVPHDEPLLQQLTAKYAKPSRLEKIRAEVEKYREDLMQFRPYEPFITYSASRYTFTNTERARRIVDFTAQQLNGEWKPQFSRMNTTHLVTYNHHTEQWTCDHYSNYQVIGAMFLHDPADLPLLIELCGDELDILRGA